MKIKRIIAVDMRQALRQVREELGEDAVILSNKKVADGVELVAAMDFDQESMRQRALTQDALSGNRPAMAPGSAGKAGAQAPAAASRPRFAKPSAPLFGRSEPSSAAAPEFQGNAAADDGTLKEMRKELGVLRNLLETQLSVIGWGNFNQRHPLKSGLLAQLTALGLGSDLAKWLVEHVPAEEADPEALWGSALGLLAGQLHVDDDDILENGGVVAVVGPTGVGKTTSVAKLAARYVMRHGSRSVALISTDNFRIGAHEQLLNFARILDVPLHRVHQHEELGRVLEDVRDKQLVLIDTAGMSQRDMRLMEQFAALQQASAQIRTYLVLSANTQLAALDDIVRNFRRADLAGAIVTKVDEATSLGGMITALVRHALPMAFLGTGQRVPEDLQAADAEALVSRAVDLMQQYAEDSDDDTLAIKFSGLGVHAG